MSLCRVGLLVTFTSIASTAHAQAVTDLGTLGGTQSTAYAVNAQAQVVGFSAAADGFTHVFSWTRAGGMIDLGRAGATTTSLLAPPPHINASGQVVGSVVTGGGPTHAFVWTQANGMTDLGTLPGGTESYALDVNAGGQVVGYATVGTGTFAPYHAFIWTHASGMIDLGTFGGAFSQADAVNDNGQAVGFSWTSSAVQPQHAFSWTTAAGMIDLGTGTIDATAVNAGGQVVGYYAASPTLTRAFIWTAASGLSDIGTLGGNLTVATSINKDGIVAGYSAPSAASFAPHAFAWTNATGMVDLGTFGGAQSRAFAINAVGQIAGSASTASGSTHAFSWTQATGLLDLGTLGGSMSFANAVNDVGQVAGGANLAGDTASHATLWTLFAGVPGQKNCVGQSISAMAAQYGGLSNAAASLGYASVADLQTAVHTSCKQ